MIEYSQLSTSTTVRSVFKNVATSSDSHIPTNDGLNLIDTPPRVLLSEEATVIIIWIIDAIVCQAIDLFGIGTNFINIVCFIRQGFQDPVNVSLLGLAIADLGCLITLVWANVFVTPAFSSADLPFDATEVMFLTSGLAHVTFARISAWITALITLERCLCITAPLKVKYVVTSKRVAIVIICVFVVLMASVAPIYVVNRLALKYFPDRNKTLIGIVYSENAERVEQICYVINNGFISFTAFVVIIISTIILVWKLRKTAKWRVTSTSAGQGEKMSHRSNKVAMMVVMISILFLACFIPVSLLFIAMSVLPELSIVGKLKNIVMTVGGLAVILESINSSSNIFIYYHMSSNYRAAFQQIFLGRNNR